MNSNRLTFKDFLVVYLLIFSIIIFLAGFFVGAKVMENRMVSTQTKLEENGFYSESEISTYYNNIIEPGRNLLEMIYINNNTTSVNPTLKESYLKQTESVLNSLSDTRIQSPFLLKAQERNKNSAILLVESIKSNSFPEQKVNVFQEYLYGQENWYKSIWLWHQSHTSKAPSKLITESESNWAIWNQANIHQKNYIVSKILAKLPILTLAHPENITVHIDAYIKSNKESDLSIEDLIKLFITSNAIRSGDFMRYKDWYVSTKLPMIKIYTND